MRWASTTSGTFTPRQFAHASAIYVLTPEGKLSKYFYGIEYSPKDMRLGLVEASQNKIGNAVDQILLFCYHFDPHAGQVYALSRLDMLRVAGAATVLIAGGICVHHAAARQQAERESGRLTNDGTEKFPAFSGSGVDHRRSGRRALCVPGAGQRVFLAADCVSGRLLRGQIPAARATRCRPLRWTSTASAA